MSNQPVNVKFADTYVGCSTLANIMGLHEETVRKRAKRGKIPGALVNGKWTFKHDELVAKGIQPFASNPLGAPVPNLCGTPPPSIPPIARVNHTDVVFVLDRSGSMGGLMNSARANLDQQLATLRTSAGPNDRYRITIVCFDNTVIKTATKVDISSIGTAASLYLHASGMTAMNDAIMEAIGSTVDAKDDHGQAFLISIVTDGGENSSHTGLSTVAAKVRELTATGRYTFAYAGPPGSEGYASSIAIPSGNVTTWEQSLRGSQTLGVQTASALNSYTATRSRGIMSSTSFYAQPVVSNPQDFAGKLGAQLTKLDPSSFKVERVMDTDPLVIQKFAEAKLGGFHKGKIYYQLTESEKVQDYKAIVIQDTATGAFYSGRDAASKLLGIPLFSGTVRIKPGDLGEFKVFVQSTSLNRKLVPGTAVVYLP